MAGRPSKRLKTSRGPDGYMPGNITEIELHNFMTFNQLKCQPASRLNLVIGPNGSGKSSIVCAVALGLGGEPQLLGRASSIGAYVKRGEELGYVRITLRGHNEEENIVITRKIDTRNKSEWMLNGTVVLKKDIMEVIQKFNIQVSNLTQFLPQDRVCEFAKLSPVQLLEETEKAVGDPHLPVSHRILIDKSNELKRLDMTLKKNGETLNQLRSLNAEQEKDVQRVRQRQHLLKKVESMKKKLPWLNYDMKKSHYMEAKAREKDSKKKLDEAARILNDLREPIEKEKKSKRALDASGKRSRDHLDGNDRRQKEFFEELLKLGVQLKGKHSEMEELKRQEDSRHQRIVKAKKDLAAAEMDLANLPLYEPPKDEIEKLGSEILELDFSAKGKNMQRSDEEKILIQKKGLLRQCIDRLKDMENTSNKLLQALERTGAHRISDAYKWLKEHRHQLNKEVFGPVLLEVNVSSRKHADYLEGHVASYIWKAFITQDADDRNFLFNNLRSFDVPILNYVQTDSRRKQPLQISAEVKRFGIYSRMDQIFDAPDVVKEVLISQSGLEHSYVGSKETDQRAIEVSKLNILDFWTPENHYRWSKSRYGGHISAVVEPVNQSRLLLCSSDSGEIERFRSQKKDLEEAIDGLEQSCRQLQSEQRCLEDEAAKLQRQREDIISAVQLEKRKRRDLENVISMRKRKLESIDKEGDVDMTSALARIRDHTAAINAQRFRALVEIKNLLLHSISCRRAFALDHMASIEQDAKIKEMESDLRQHDKFAQQASLLYDQCKQTSEKLREDLAVAKKHAESVAVITAELERAFREMPATIEELQVSIEDTISEANSILFLNQNILEEYEMRCRSIEDIAARMEVDERDKRRCIKEIDSVKEKWLPMLRNLVRQINEYFSRNFQEMAVAGEVLLDEHDRDFDQYGIHIKVKFRETGQLQVLSSHHQSGGERSVSTILYLVSLQDLTNCPFRVVDEINQGMDPINERKMFQQLVRAATQPNTPQCFLLTPKLLPDLEYTETCSILNIMNGPWIDQPSKVWSHGGSWGLTTATLKQRS